MPKLLLISYDLKGPLSIYEGFFSELREKADLWWHHLDSTWLIRSERDPKYWASILRPHMQPSDNLLVMEIACQAYFGWLPAEAWDWLKENNIKTTPYLTPHQPRNEYQVS